MRQLHVATSPLTNTIYAGHVLKGGRTWGDGKQDVTGEACAAVCIHALAAKIPVVVSCNGVPTWEITVRELKAPCNEPANLPEFPDSSTAPPDTQRTDPPNCDWHRDEFGNWFSGCSETMPDFTPWKGTDPKGSFCPKCGEIITVRVHDKP